MRRSSGILLPISALPSNYGIGTLGVEAYNFIDFLVESGQKYWQILPVGPVSFGDSPYQSFSVYAGNPYYIDLDILIDMGFIKESDCSKIDVHNIHEIDYQKQFNMRYLILRKSYENSKVKLHAEIEVFRHKHKSWVEDYALFMAFKIKNNNAMWQKWDEQIRTREAKAVHEAENEHEQEIMFWIFLQYMFYEQYYKLKRYANSRGISIIGDIPVYASEDSADVWANSSIFMLDEHKIPTLIAGVPPDAFSADGQLWGNPVYNWEYLKNTHYDWWIERIKWAFKMYDAVRIDHFRGFDEFWAVPRDSVNAINGKWYKAYGMELFDMINLKLGNHKIIAEDLGIITSSVNKLKKHLGYPGMKVLQFAFDGNPNNPYLPRNYEENCIAYTGTHDNDTLMGWFESLNEQVKNYVRKSLKINPNLHDDLNFSIIETLYESKAELCIIPLYDFLSLGSEARINTPSTLGNNWKFRISKSMIDYELAEKIKEYVIKSDRMDFS